MTGHPSRREGFLWECPYCGMSRLNASDGESGETNAIAALRSHIVATDGAKHGPKNEYPADYDTLDPAEYVIEVDGGRR